MAAVENEIEIIYMAQRPLCIAHDLNDWEPAIQFKS